MSSHSQPIWCKVLDAADSPVQIRWFKDNQEILGAQARSSGGQQSGGSNSIENQVELVTSDEIGSANLVFRKVQPQHSGNYTCLATNHYGSSSYSSLMSVKVPPKWKVEPQDKQSIVGEQLAIDCQAFGNPNPFIRWKFTSPPQHQSLDQPETSHPQNFKLLNSNHHVQTLENGSLAIRHTTKEQEGFYLCEADNGVEPSLMKVVRLVVHLQAQFSDDIFAFDSSDGRQIDKLEATLKSAKTAMTQLAGPQQQPATYKIHRVNLGATQLRLNCQPFGDLPLTVEWLKDGQPLYTHSAAPGASTDDQTVAGSSQISTSQTIGHLSASRYHANTRRKGPNLQNYLESELIIASIRREDAGLYSCSARNAYGQSERRIRVVVQEAPEAPELVDVAHIASRSVGLRWLAPFDGNAMITKYIVEYRRLPDSPDMNQVTDPSSQVFAQSEKLIASASALAKVQEGSQQMAQTQLQHTVHELEPLTRYTIRVVAVNALGRSRPSIALSLRTEEEVPSTVPSPVDTLVLSSKSIKLQWSITYAPEREIIEGFFVGYRSFDSKLAPAASLGADQGALAQAKLQENKEESTYTYKTLRLNNAANSSSISSIVSSTRPHLVNQNSQDARRDLDSLSPVSSITKTVPKSSNGLTQSNQADKQLLVVSSFEYVISGLARNTEYSLLIQCFNQKGAGPTSDPVVFKTFLNDPPEKLTLHADEISDSSIKLSWRFMSNDVSASINSNSAEPVDGYVLTFAKMNSPMTGSMHHRKLLSNDMFDSNSNRSQPAARISNSIPSSQQLPTIQHPLTGVDQWQAIQLAPHQRTHQLKNLDCGSYYAIKIWAFNKIGKGEPSEILNVNTKGKTPVAPDGRSFISVNSTQVKLHLNAWFDGGCEIERFVAQYRIRGQSEWILVSNNILREQGALLIRDLIPATSYELLIGARNQVGTTEVRYKFTTLDSSGKPVYPSNAHSLFGTGSIGPVLDDESADYSAEDSSIRREIWPSSDSPTALKSLAMFRQILNSPLALLLSLSTFVALLLLLLFHRFNGLSNSSNGTLNSASTTMTGGKSVASSIAAHPLDGSAIDTCTVNNASNFAPTIDTNSLTEESPQNLAATSASHRLFASECPYQTYCDPNQQAAVDYGRTLASNYEQRNACISNYASVQKSASMDPGAEMSPQQQQCILQMLSMNQPQDGMANQCDPYITAAALSTMARGKTLKPNMRSINSFENYQSANPNLVAATLGRQFGQQQFQHRFSGEFYQMDTFIPAASNAIDQEARVKNCSIKSGASTSGRGSDVPSMSAISSSGQESNAILLPPVDDPNGRHTSTPNQSQPISDKCDKKTHYDVPFKFRTNSSAVLVEIEDEATA